MTETRNDQRDDHLSRPRQKDAFGGIRFGADFFGWLAATGTAVCLTAMAAAVATALTGRAGGLVTGAGATTRLGAGVGITVLVIAFVAHLAGGYTAGRMARFSGLRQGFGVWLWAVLITVVVVGVGMILRNRPELSGRIDLIPRLAPVSTSMTTTGIVAALIIAGVALIGALIGGLFGMRYHRRIDRISDDDGRLDNGRVDGGRVDDDR